MLAHEGCCNLMHVPGVALPWSESKACKHKCKAGSQDVWLFKVSPSLHTQRARISAHPFTDQSPAPFIYSDWPCGFPPSGNHLQSTGSRLPQFRNGLVCIWLKTPVCSECKHTRPRILIKDSCTHIQEASSKSCDATLSSACFSSSQITSVLRSMTAHHCVKHARLCSFPGLQPGLADDWLFLQIGHVIQQVLM